MFSYHGVGGGYCGGEEYIYFILSTDDTEFQVDAKKVTLQKWNGESNAELKKMFKAKIAKEIGATAVTAVMGFVLIMCSVLVS